MWGDTCKSVAAEDPARLLDGWVVRLTAGGVSDFWCGPLFAGGGAFVPLRSADGAWRTVGWWDSKAAAAEAVRGSLGSDPGRLQVVRLRDVT